MKFCFLWACGIYIASILNAGHDTTRSVLSWLMLLIFFAQRIIGLVGGEIVYAVEVESRRNPTEEVMVEKIRSEKGLDMQVAVRSEAELEHLLKLGYSTPFLFSAEVDGQTVYYTLDDDPASAEAVNYAPLQTPDAQIPPNGNRALKNKLIADFYFQDSAFQLTSPALIKLPGAALPSCRQAPFIPTPSPPPKAA